MLVNVMKSKLHRATVTEADIDYEGSIGVDLDLLEVVGMFPHEQVDVLNITNGQRFTTYAIAAPAGSRSITINGAAARLVQPGDKVIVVAYAQIPQSEAATFHPRVALMTADNRVASLKDASGADMGDRYERA